MPQVDEAEAAEFAALVAELSAEQVEGEEDAGDEEAAPEADSSRDPEEDEESEEEQENEPEGSEDETDEEGEEDPDEEDDPDDLEAGLSPQETEAAKMFLDGKIKEACKRLGLDPKIFKIKPREFTAMRKGLREADQKLRQATVLERQGRQLNEQAENTYGAIVAGFRAYKGGEPLKVKAAIELMAEDSFENIVATVARAAKGLSPAEVELMKIRKEREDEKRAENERKVSEGVAAQEAKEIATLTTRLAKTPLAKVPTAAAEIRALVVKSFDGTGYGTTVQEAYKEVRAKYTALAEAVTGKPLTFSKSQKGKETEGKTGKGKKRSELAPLRQGNTANLTPEQQKEAARKAEAEEFKRSVREAAADDRHSRRYGRR